MQSYWLFVCIYMYITIQKIGAMRNTNFNRKRNLEKYNLLNKMYDRLINQQLRSNDEGRWETYDLILYELYNEGNHQIYDEIRYRITDGEDPNEVFYDIIRKGDYSSGLIWIMKRRIEEYMDEDSYKRFYE